MIKPKIILGIESSCDETACAIMQKDGDRVTILSNVVASSADLQAKYGGVIPEQAAREQLSSIIPVVQEALSQAFPLHPKPYTLINAIAVTQGPGLIGSLLIGVETAKVLAIVWKKPLIPINHLLGHFYANWIDCSSSPLRSNNESLPAVNSGVSRKRDKFLSAASSSPEADDEFARDNKQSLQSIDLNYSSTKHSARRSTLTPQFPAIGLLVSGGHTDLVLFSDHGKYKYLGGTRDDAAGECFDKCARLLGLPYPGGPNLSKLAKTGNPKAFNLPRPMLNSKDLDFSFSGLKTAVFNLVTLEGVARVGAPHRSPAVSTRMSDGAGERQDPKLRANLCASIENAITDVLVEKTVVAIQTHNVDQIIVAGGVAANRILTQKLNHRLSEIIPHARVFIPPPSLATDNAASIATAAFFNYHPINPLELQANPNLTFS